MISCPPDCPFTSHSLSLSLSLKIILIGFTGERNHFQQMTQSLGKELKRVLKSSQMEVKQLSNELESQKEKYDVRQNIPSPDSDSLDWLLEFGD